MANFMKALWGAAKFPVTEAKWIGQETLHAGKDLLHGDFKAFGKDIQHSFGDHQRLIGNSFLYDAFGKNKITKNSDAIAGAIVGSVFAAGAMGGAAGGAGGGAGGGAAGAGSTGAISPIGTQGAAQAMSSTAAQGAGQSAASTAGQELAKDAATSSWKSYAMKAGMSLMNQNLQSQQQQPEQGPQGPQGSILAQPQGQWQGGAFAGGQSTSQLMGSITPQNNTPQFSFNTGV